MKIRDSDSYKEERDETHESRIRGICVSSLLPYGPAIFVELITGLIPGGTSLDLFVLTFLFLLKEKKER